MRATDIVRHRRERERRGKGPGRRGLRVVGVALLVIFTALLLLPLTAAAGGAANLLYFVGDLPDAGALEALPAHFPPTTATTWLFAWGAPDADGLRHPVYIDEIADPRAGSETWAQPDELPSAVTDAFLASFDPQFLTAVSPSLSAVWDEWGHTGVIDNRHSPIVRDLILTHLREGLPAQPGDTRRAMQDWLLGWQIERRYSRDQLLEWLINTRYYGHLAYGIEAAARVYFDKSAAELTSGQAAMLAALARNPSANPFDDPVGARLVRAEVLSAMAAMGAITADEEASASREALATAAPPGSESIAPEFARLARRELEAILGPERLLSGGWQVETTLDLFLQEQATCAAANPQTNLTGGVPSAGGGPHCPAAGYLTAAVGDADDGAIADSAIVVIDPVSGEIEALVGDATDHTARSIGTLVRPFIYLTALSQGHTAATLTMDVPDLILQEEQPDSPRNPDGQYLGPLRLRAALAAGRAVPATQVLSWVGVDLVRETARALGLQPDSDDGSSDLSFAERGFTATPLDLARTFAIFGNGGAAAGMVAGDAAPRPATIRRITDTAGREVYAFKSEARETLAAELAFLLTDMLADHETRCALFDCDDGLDLPEGRRAAFASGESSTGESWAVGYTPARIISVRIGGENVTAGAAGPLWRALMAWSSENASLADWARPAGLRSVDVCAVSGQLPSPAARCPTVAEWFISGTEPVATDTMTREVATNRETGRLATIFTPPALIEWRTYTVYPPEATAWAEDAGIELPPAEFDTIPNVPTRVGGAELAVEPWSVVRGLLPILGSATGEDFDYYRLAYFPGLMPEAMQNLVERGETPVESAELAMWDTTSLEDGLYTLLLTVIRQDGAFDEVAIPVTVGNN